VSQKIEEALGIRKIPINPHVESSKTFPMRPGTLLKEGIYKIVRGLASGGQGRVYIAENTQLGNRVLIKTPYYSSSMMSSVSPQERSILVKETHELLSVEKDMLSMFHSQTSMVPQPLDFFFDKTYETTLEIYLPGARQVPYMVLEYIQGFTLDLVDKLSAREALQIGERLCHVIGAFHQKNYIYQDLKLANVIIDERGRNIYLIDLGSLCLLDPKTETPCEDMITFGTYTPGYRAPEWLEGSDHCGKKSDIYTIGATLWALISGESPGSYFQKWADVLSSRRRKGSIGEMTYDSGILDAESLPLPLEKMNLTPQEESAGVRVLIEKTMERSPQKRHSSVEELRKNIQMTLQKLK
jgi:serine/threonine protein kinase